MPKLKISQGSVSTRNKKYGGESEINLSENKLMESVTLYRKSCRKYGVLEETRGALYHHDLCLRVNTHHTTSLSLSVDTRIQMEKHAMTTHTLQTYLNLGLPPLGKSPQSKSKERLEY